MTELHERTVLIPEISDGEAREAFFQIMSILNERNCSMDENDTLWRAYKKHFIFLLFKHGVIENLDSPADSNGFERM